MSPDRDHLGRKLSTLRLCALFHRTIILRCTRCGHSRKLDAIALWWLFEGKRWDDDLREARRRFYCPRLRPIAPSDAHRERGASRGRAAALSKRARMEAAEIAVSVLMAGGALLADIPH
jgi:hypothetical protein